MKVLHRLWADENGFVISSELILVGTMLVLGMIVGLTELRNQVVQELADLAVAIGRVNQTYVYSEVAGHSAVTAGSGFQDTNDFCDEDGVDPAGDAAAGILVETTNTPLAAVEDDVPAFTVPTGP
jgi:hypothetical protein